MDERVVRALRALPAPVPVHRVVATDDGGDPAHAQLRELLLEPVEVRGRALRGRVAPVGEEVDEDAIEAVVGAEVQQREEMILGRVHPLVLDETHEVQARAARLAVAEGGAELRVRVKARAGDHLVDADDFLLDDPARAHVEVPDFGRALDALAHPERRSRRLEPAVREAREQPVDDRRPRELDRVPVYLVTNPPAVADDEDEGRVHVGSPDT